MAEPTADLPVTTDPTAAETPDTVHHPTEWLRPPTDVAETDRGLELWLDLPGVAKADVQLEVEGTELRIEAARDDRYGYRRAFTLPREIDPGGIAAQMEAGVLHLTLPRSEAFSRRVIEIA